VEQNSGASLIDLGDGVACLEFHTKMNAIGADILQMVQAAVKRLETDFDGLVVGNQGPHFSVGANLMLLLMTIQEEEWDDIDLVIRAFQNATMSLKYAPRPVVIAPHGMVLGGGCEFVLHGDCVRRRPILAWWRLARDSSRPVAVPRRYWCGHSTPPRTSSAG
jgi:3-hydroxyacyl-CoA dehydrogenase